MISELKKLSIAELELLIKAPILVSILIAGADGQIDRNEINIAIATARQKAKSKSSLQAYYETVSEDFEDKLKVLIQSYPSAAEQRNSQISEELAGLNDILKRVQGNLSVEIYDSLKSLALSIAKASGSIFGSSMGTKEAQLVDLKMVKPPSASA